MKVATPCMICGAAFATHQCTRCGSLVCDTDFDSSKGVCGDCSTGQEASEKDEKRQDRVD